MSFFSLRRLQAEDLDAVLRLFYDTVHAINARDYTPAQLDAWAPVIPDISRWQRIFSQHSLVSELNGLITGIGTMAAGGYIDLLYVHKDYQGRGIASALLRAMEAHARASGLSRLYTEASITARPVFEKQGFVMLRTNAKVFGGEVFVNYVMEKGL